MLAITSIVLRLFILICHLIYCFNVFHKPHFLSVGKDKNNDEIYSILRTPQINRHSKHASELSVFSKGEKMITQHEE